MRALSQATLQTKTVLLGKLLGVAGFAALLSLATLVKVPLFFTPVPVTLQNFVVFLAGAMLGPLAGMAAVVLYIVLGSCLGTLAFFGPTGGYLVGFAAAAGLIGMSRPALGNRNIFVSFLVMLAGIFVIYLFGGLWLALGYGWPIKQVIAFGLLPFLGGDLIKALVAAAVSRKGRL